MKRLLARLLALLFIHFLAFPFTFPAANAQQAQIVAVCGVPPPPYSNLGAVLPLTMDITGKLCSNAGAGAPSTPCTTTALSVQYNAAGSLGCVSGATSNGTAITFAANDLILGGVTGSTQCLQAGATGIVTGTGSACGAGGGAVSSVSNADQTLTISPTTGAVVASLALAHANTWAAVQTFPANDLLLSGVTGSTQCLQASTTGVVTGTGSPCGGSGSTPGGAASSVQYNNAGAFGGFGLWDGTTTLSLGNTVTPQAFRVYNTVDTLSSPTNYERGVFDWTTTANTLTIGTQAGGTGTARNLQFVAGGINKLDYGVTTAGVWTVPIFFCNTAIAVCIAGASTLQAVDLASTGLMIWGASANAAANSGAADIGLGRNAAGVLEVDSGTAAAFRDLTLRHLGGQGTPTASACAGFAALAGSSDLGGKITYTSATTCNISFASAFTNAPSCVVSPGTAVATTLVTTTTTVMSVTFGTAQTAFSYHCHGL